MDNQTENSPTNVSYALGRIEGKIDSFKATLSEQTTRMNVISTVVEGLVNKSGGHEERLKNLEGRPSLASDISDLKTRMAYWGGGLAVVAFCGPFIFRTLMQAMHIQ